MSKRWQSALRNKSFIVLLSFSIASLLAWGIAASHFFAFIQQRQGRALDDFVLETLPAFNLSIPVFTLLYSLIIVGIIKASLSPHAFLTAALAYLMLTLFRIVTLFLAPLEEPLHLIPLNDPFVDTFFYQQHITKDLFFSGHTSIVFLLAFLVERGLLKKILFVGAVAIGTMILIQHAHYTIDVLAAPLFAWAAYKIALILKRLAGSDI